MKTLKNKKTSLNMIINQKEVEGATYAQIINVCIDQARMVNPNGEFVSVSISEMRTRIKLMDILDESSGDIKLEDDIYEQVKSYVLLKGENGWQINNKELVQFEDDYVSAK